MFSGKSHFEEDILSDLNSPVPLPLPSQSINMALQKARPFYACVYLKSLDGSRLRIDVG